MARTFPIVVDRTFPIVREGTFPMVLEGSFTRDRPVEEPFQRMCSS